MEAKEQKEEQPRNSDRTRDSGPLDRLARFILPDFLIGRDSVWSDVKIIATHPRFRPLRHLFFIIFILLLGVVVFVYHTGYTPWSAEADSWWNTDYQYRQKITINSSNVATTTTSGFPILASTTQSVLKHTSHGGNVTSATGTDIAFVHSDDSTVLDYHIEEYASSTGALTAWVEAQDISSTTDKTLYMYYGNSGAADRSDEAGAFDSLGETGVWYLSEEESGTGNTGVYKDSTSNNNDGDDEVSATGQDGKIDGGQKFDGSDDYITMGSAPETEVAGSVTVSAWIKPNSVPSEWRIIAGRSEAGNEQYDLRTHNSDGSLVFLVRDSADFYIADSGSTTTNTWIHLTGVFDSANKEARVYFDGNLMDTVSTADSNLNTGGNFFTVGGRKWDGSWQDHFDGTIDNVNVYNRALSAGTITTQYNNQNDPFTFLTFRSEEVQNNSPDTPTNSSPYDGDTGVSLTTTLNSSTFSDPDSGDTHQASEWQIATSSSSFSSPIWETGATTTALEQVSVPEDTLTASTTYHWRVRHQDSEDAWSGWSSSTSFSTVINWKDASWKYRQKITVDSSKVSGFSTLTDFPVLVDVSDLSSGFFANVNGDGSDIFVTKADGTTKLSRELERIATSTNAGELWFKAPELSTSTPTEFFVYYGNSTASETDDTDVWSNSYTSVWHLLEEQSGTGNTGVYKDSTSNNNDGDDEVSATGQSGKIDGGQEFDGSSDHVALPELGISGSNANYTVSGWVRTNDRSEDQFWLSLENDFSSPWQLGLSWENSAGDLVFYDGSNYNVIDNIQNDTWVYVTVVHNSSLSPEIRGYANGVEKVEITDNHSDGSRSGKSAIGDHEQGGSLAWNGELDEVRVQDTARSSGWVTTEYNNQDDPSSFYTASAEQDSPNDPPNTPSTTDPSDGANNVAPAPTLESSDFSDPNPNDTHQASRWQVTDAAGDYSSPVLDTDRDASNLTSYSVPSGTLEEDTTYYWRVRHQDSEGLWSSYSSEASFTTAEPPNQPSTKAPRDGAVNQSTVLNLKSSDFSDPDSGGTHASSTWLVRTADDPTYSNPVFESLNDGSNLTSITVPSGNLKQNTVYYWKVAHIDEYGLTATSSESTFVTGTVPIVVISVGATEYQSGETARLTVQVTDATEDPVTDATTTLDMFDPSGNKIADSVEMSYIPDSEGLYVYSTTTPDTEGVYTYTAKAEHAGETSFSSHVFHVSPALNTIKENVDASVSSRASTSSVSDVQDTVDDISTTTDDISTTTDNIQNTVDSISTTTDEISTTTDDIQNTVNSVETTTENLSTTTNNIQGTVDSIETTTNSTQSSVDRLVGAQIVTDGSVDDSSPGTTTFETNLSKSTDDFYKDGVITFTSGTLDGQNRRIAGYNSGTSSITVGPALSSAPADGDEFTIVAQNVRVQEQVSDVSGQLDTIEGKVDTIQSDLNTIDSNLDSVKTTVENIRSSQQSAYTVSLSDASEVSTGNSYRAEVTVEDFESEPTDASSTPTITIYDSERSKVVDAATMSKDGTGQYSYAHAVASDATTGLWQAAVGVDVGGSNNVVRNDFWQVTGSPAKVEINSVTDKTLSSITANATIENEGNSETEYQYEWCVVSQQSNECGGDDDVDYASAAKLLASGESFSSDLDLTVDNTGDYWFKLVVNFGTESSAASQSFTATQESDSGSGSSGGSADRSSSFDDSSDLEAEVTKLGDRLAQQSDQLSRVLQLIGDKDPSSSGFSSLLELRREELESMREIQNKAAELEAVSRATKRLVEQNSSEAIVETYMKFNSVEMGFLVTNPLDKEKTLTFESQLPKEVKPEHIEDSDGLNVKFDTNSDTYYVTGEVTLGPQETITKVVKMKDIWRFEPQELQAIKRQAAEITRSLADTRYSSQATLLKGDINETVRKILRTQQNSYTEPQEHILTYRENQSRFADAKKSLEELKGLASDASASQGLLGSIGNIQTFSTWGIILAIVFGFVLLAGIVFAMWRSQMRMMRAMRESDGRDESDQPDSVAETSNFDDVAQPGKADQIDRRSDRQRSDFSNDSSNQQEQVGVFAKLFTIAIIIVAAFVLYSGWQYLSEEQSKVEYNSSGQEKVAPQAPENTSPEGAGENKSKDLDTTTEPENVTITSTSSTGSNNTATNSELEPGGSGKTVIISDTPTGYLNVRAEPTRSGELIERVNPGQEFLYTERRNDWYQITLDDGRSGWVAGMYVSEK